MLEEHLDPAQFHGFVSGTLTPAERDAALVHLDGCSRCRQLLSALASDGPQDTTATIDGAEADPTVDLRKARAEHAPLLTPNQKRLHFDESTAPDARPLLPTEESVSVRRQAPLQVENLPLPSDRLVGQKLGDYLVQELLAKGGMGAVYRGVQPLIGKQIAIKVLLNPGPAELNYAQRMLEEARTVNAIGHPNIIDIFNFGELPDGRPYLVMEYLDGVSVSQWVRARTSDEAPIARIVTILDQICAALEAVHVVGVVHRDLKPANVMLMQLSSPEPRVKVLDFGFAKSRDATLRTSPDMVLGTPGYMSPEQIQAIGATPQSDLYALGLMAFFMITGLDAYADKSPIAVLQLQLAKEPPSLRGHPGVPDALAQLIAELTRIDPRLRPASATVVRARLAAIAADAPQPVVPSAEAITQKERHPPAPPRPSREANTLKPGRQAVAFDLKKTDVDPAPGHTAPELPSVGARRPSSIEAAVDGAMSDLSRSQVRSVRGSRWPWLLAVGAAVAMGLATWLALR
ncbi:MAG: serine/threonine protein kinase [Myxococcus sp.]|nr:serine/threonine protein kinase [Myxococcus sp.]